MIISFYSLTIHGASKSQIGNIVKIECDYFEIEESIEIADPFSKTDSRSRSCHMQN